MDPQALLVAFDKARVETEYDRDLQAQIAERRLIYRSKGEWVCPNIMFLDWSVEVWSL